MKLSTFQISIGLSLLFHGVVFGLVYVASQPHIGTQATPALNGLEIIEIVAESEAVPALQPQIATTGISEPLVELKSPVDFAPISLVAEIKSAPMSLKEDLAAMEEAVSPSVPTATERVLSSPDSPSTVAVATSKPVIYGVGYLNNPKPAYPREARRLRQEGLVILSLVVTQAGNAAAIRVKQGSGFHLLDDAALIAVKQWRFTPAHVGNTAVASEVEIPVRFRLSG